MCIVVYRMSKAVAEVRRGIVMRSVDNTDRLVVRRRMFTERTDRCRFILDV